MVPAGQRAKDLSVIIVGFGANPAIFQWVDVTPLSGWKAEKDSCKD